MMRIDSRADKGGWSYGKTWAEFRRCQSCGHNFIGDKTAWQCADCAYGAKP
jgi:rubrerythrin